MIFKVVGRARRRFLWNALAREGARAASTGLGTLVLLLVLGTDIMSWRWIFVISAITLAAGAYIIIKRRPDAYDIAQRLDSRLGLSDTLSTAVFFWSSSSGRGDAGMRLAQRERAMRVAADVDLRAAFPIKIPKGICASALAFALLAAVLITARFHFSGRLELRAPIAGAVLQLFREAKTELVKLQDKLHSKEAPEADRSRAANDADPDGGKSPATGDSPGQAENAAAEEKTGESAAQQPGSDRAEAEKLPGDAEQKPNGGNPSAKSGQDQQQRQGEPGPGQQSAEQPGSSSSMFSKISDTVANLVSALKPQSASPKDAAASRNAASGTQSQKSEAGATQSAQGSASRSDEEGSPGDAKGAMAPASANADSDSQQRPGSGIGSNDGSKQIKEAEQLEAMGKISVILGKRALDVTGTAYAEVTTVHQELKTQYEVRNAQHSDVHAKAERDEVPMELQEYVAEYFRETRKAAPGASRTAKRGEASSRVAKK